mgnify:CR=1 FL=1
MTAPCYINSCFFRHRLILFFHYRKNTLLYPQEYFQFYFYRVKGVYFQCELIRNRENKSISFPLISRRYSRSFVVARAVNCNFSNPVKFMTTSGFNIYYSEHSKWISSKFSNNAVNFPDIISDLIKIILRHLEHLDTLRLCAFQQKIKKIRLNVKKSLFLILLEFNH